MAVKVDNDKCTGCGSCVECGACVNQCPNEAISF